MTPPGQDQNNGDLRFSATLQDNVSPTAAAIEERLKKLGASKSEIKIFLRAYDEASAKAQQVHKEINKLPKEHKIRIRAETDEAMDKLKKIREFAMKPIDYSINVKHNAETTLNDLRGRMQRFQVESGQAFARLPVFGPVSRGLAPVVGPMAQSALGQVGLGVGGLGAVGGSIALMQKSIDVNSSMEQSLVTLNQTLKDGAKAQSESLKLVDFAKKTPFNYQDVLSADVRYRQYGMNPNGPLGLKKAGDMSAALGTPISQGTEAIADARMGYFVRMMSYGIRLTREDFAPGGKYQGKTFEQGTEMALKRFEGAMEVQSKTFQGVMSNLQDIVTQQIVQPIGQNVFSSMRATANNLQTALWDPNVQRQIGQTIETLQTGIDMVLQKIAKAKDFFMLYLEQPLHDIMESFIKLGAVISKAFMGTTTTAVKYFAEALTAILQPITAVANKVPFLFQILGFAKALQFLGFEKTAQPFNDLLAAVNPLTGSFSQLKKVFGESFQLLKTGTILLAAKALIDTRTAATALTESFMYLGDTGQGSVDRLQRKVDLLSGAMDRSASSAKRLVAEIANVAPDQGKGPLSKSFQDYLLKAAEETSFTEKQFKGGAASKDLIIRELGRIKAQTPEAAHETGTQIRSQILALSSSLGISHEEAAKQENLSFTTFQDALKGRKQNSAQGAYLATATYGALKPLPVTDQQLNLGFKSPRELTDYILKRTLDPTQEDVMKQIQKGGLSKYYNISPVVTQRTSEKLQSLEETDQSFKDQYTNAVDNQKHLVKTFKTDVAAGLPKPVDVYGDLNLAPNFKKFGAAPGLATGVAEEWNRMGKLVPQVQDALQHANEALGMWEVKTAQAQQRMAALNNEMAKFNYHQIVPLQHAIQDIQLNIAKYSTAVISPLQRAMAALNMQMSKYQHENILPIQRSQEDWNMTMTRTANKLSDVNEKMAVASYQMNKYNNGLLTGEQAWQDNMHALDMYSKRLQLAMMEQKGFAEDLSRTTFNEGFSTTIKPLMGFSLQKQQEMVETRKQIEQLKGEINFDKYDLQKAGRSKWERTEMPLEQRVAETKKWRDILDKGQEAQYSLERLTYKQSVHARNLNEQLYMAQKNMRPLQDQAYNFEQSMAGASLHVAKMQEDASKLQNELTSRQQGPTARGFERDQYVSGQAQYGIQIQSYRAQQRVGQLETQLTEVRNTQQTLGNILKELIQGQTGKQYKEAIKVLADQGVLSPEQAKSLEKILSDTPGKHRDAAEKTVSIWMKAFYQIKQGLIGLFTFDTYFKIGDVVKQTVDSVLKRIGIQSTGLGTVTGSFAGLFAALAAINAARIGLTNVIARGIPAALRPLGILAPETFGRGGRVARAGAWITRNTEAQARDLLRPQAFAKSTVGSIAGATVGRWLGGGSQAGQIIGTLLGGFLGGQWGTRTGLVSRASTAATGQATNFSNWAAGTRGGRNVLSLGIDIAGWSRFQAVTRFFQNSTAIKAITLPFRVIFSGLGSLGRALGFAGGAAGEAGALGGILGMAGRTLGKIALPIALISGTSDVIFGRDKRTVRGGVGTLAGAGIGAAVGTAFFGIGAVPGAAIGSSIGFLIGQLWGDIGKYFRKGIDLFKRTVSRMLTPEGLAAALLAPITGGYSVFLRLFGSFAEKIPGKIGYALGFAVGRSLRIIGEGFYLIGKTYLSFVTGSIRLVTRAINNIPDLMWSLITGAVAFITDPKTREKMIAAVEQGAVDLGTSIIEALKSIFQAAIDFAKHVAHAPLDFLKGAVSGLKHGLGLAGGIDEVPRDNFPANLHKGEAVLQYLDAKQWRDWKRNKDNAGSFTAGMSSSASVMASPLGRAATVNTNAFKQTAAQLTEIEDSSQKERTTATKAGSKDRSTAEVKSLRIRLQAAKDANSKLLRADVMAGNKRAKAQEKHLDTTKKQADKGLGDTNSIIKDWTDKINSHMDSTTGKIKDLNTNLGDLGTPGKEKAKDTSPWGTLRDSEKTASDTVKTWQKVQGQVHKKNDSQLSDWFQRVGGALARDPENEDLQQLRTEIVTERRRRRIMDDYRGSVRGTKRATKTTEDAKRRHGQRGYAGGLDQVPEDGFEAVLHQGEMVLNSSEASRWRKRIRGNRAPDEGQEDQTRKTYHTKLVKDHKDTQDTLTKDQLKAEEDRSTNRDDKRTKNLKDEQDYTSKILENTKNSLDARNKAEDDGGNTISETLSKWISKNRHSINAFKRDYGVNYGDTGGSDTPNKAAGGMIDPSALIKGKGDSKGYLIHVGEEDDEMIVPLAQHRRPRAVSLIKQAMGRLGSHHFANGGIPNANTALVAAWKAVSSKFGGGPMPPTQWVRGNDLNKEAGISSVNKSVEGLTFPKAWNTGQKPGVYLNYDLQKGLTHGDTGALRVALHEWAHFFQNKSIAGNDTLAEGGADLFAQRQVRNVARVMNKKYRTSYDLTTPLDQVYPQQTKAVAKLGPDWLYKGQFAGGGFVNNVGAHIDTSAEKDIARDLARLGRSLGITFSPAGPRSARRTTAENLQVHGSATSNHLRGLAMDVAPEAIKAISNAVLHRFGLNRPMPGTWTDAWGGVHDERNHIELLGDGGGGTTPTSGGSTPASSGGDVSVPHLSKIPKSLLKQGPHGRSVYQALRRLKHQIHKRLTKASAATAPDTGHGGSAGGIPDNAHGGSGGSLSPQALDFARHFARDTGLNPRVVAAWIFQEEGNRAAPVGHSDYNWLNVGWTDSGPVSGTRLPQWKYAASAAQLTEDWMRGKGAMAKAWGPASGGIRRILSTAGKSPEEQISAIVNSGWASSAYNGAFMNVYRGMRKYAAGKDKINSDEQLALLHRGERVLNPVQASAAAVKDQGGDPASKNDKTDKKKHRTLVGTLLGNMRTSLDDLRTFAYRRSQTIAAEKTLVDKARKSSGMDPATGKAMTDGRSGRYAGDALITELAKAKELGKGYTKDAISRGVSGTLITAASREALSPSNIYQQPIRSQQVKNFFTSRLNASVNAIDSFRAGKADPYKVPTKAKAKKSTSTDKPKASAADIRGNDVGKANKATSERAVVATASATKRVASAVASNVSQSKAINSGVRNMTKVLSAIKSAFDKANKYASSIESHMKDANKYAKNLEGHMKKANSYANKVEGHLKDANRYANKIESHMKDSNKYANKIEGHMKDSNKYANKIEGHMKDANKYSNKIEGHMKDANMYSGRIESHLKDANKAAGRLEGHMKDANSYSSRIEGHMKDANSFSSRIEGHLRDANAASARLEGHMKRSADASADIKTDMKRSASSSDDIRIDMKATSKASDHIRIAMEKAAAALTDASNESNGGWKTTDRTQLKLMNKGIWQLIGGFRSAYPGKAFAGGLYRVPVDEYQATLHQDEMVLTAAAANAYRNKKPAATSLDTSRMETILMDIKASIESSKPEITVVNQAQGAKLDSTVYKRQGLTRSK